MSRTDFSEPWTAREIAWRAAVTIMILLAGCAGDPYRPTPGIDAPGRSDAGPVRYYENFIITTAREGDSMASLAARFLGDPADGWKIARFNDMESPTPGRELVVPWTPVGRGGLGPNGFQTVPVLVYHRFSRDKSDKLIITEEAFRAQMEFLKANGYTVITLDRFFDFLDFKKQIPGKSVVLTFNDGWRSLYEIAFPVLKAYGYPATLFVYTDFISGAKSMSWEQIKELSENGFDIQNLGRSHRSLVKMKKGESFQTYFNALEKEISSAEAAIEQHVGASCDYFAYPYGKSNNLASALLEKRGYRGAFTVTRGANPFFIDNFQVKRSVIYGEFDLEKFETNLKVFHHEDLGCEAPGPPPDPSDVPDETPAAKDSPVGEADAPVPADASPRPSPAAPFRTKALVLEEAGDLYEALYYWKVVEALDPDDPSVAGIIRALETRCSDGAQRHAEKGEALYKKNRLSKARAAFLTALRCDPDHERALFYAKEKLNGEKEVVHLVKQGDDLKKIAREFYGDPDKAFLIAHFNSLAPGEAPPAGARLRLPLLPREMSGAEFDVEKEMEAALALLNEQRYMEAAEAAQGILKYDPNSAGAADLLSAAYYGMSAALLREDKPGEALSIARKMLKHDPGNDDAKDLMDDARHRMGSVLLQEGKPLEALELAREMLENDPDNEVGLDLRNAVYYQMGGALSREGKPREALGMFERVAPGYKDVGPLMTETRKSLKTRADQHYRNGVKHFVHERLEGAIMEWSKVLDLDPTHKKAKRDLENARKLLEKLKAIE